MPLFAQLDALGSWLVNPWLFIAGAAAVLLPILIHLLNKRKFRVVDWAAMEFLLDADKKNRRRVRLENLLLLLLRCLAVFLIGMLLARPFLPTSVTAGLIDAAQFERIVLLDDSLSMQARLGNESAWDIAKRRLAELNNSLSQHAGDNSLTLLLTSQPDRPLFNATRLAEGSIDEVNATVERLEPSDTTANLPAALEELEKHIESQPGNVNRVVYIFTDLRRRDWREEDEASEAPLQVVGRLAKSLQGAYLFDCGDDEDRNLAITAIEPEGTLVLGVQSRFDVAVTNHGSSEAADLRVKFTAGNSLPVEATIDRLAAGETESVRFNFTFADDPDAPDAERQIEPRQVKVELLTAQQGADDRLTADSIAFFPARLVAGIPALVLDGDPSADFGDSESFYLERALAPRGPVPSGVAAQVINESGLEAIDLAKFQVVFLCNNYRLGERTAELMERLERWVEAGGGLVLFPGDQVDEQFFNEHYFKGGDGLSPVQLGGMRGDESEQTWATLRVEDANHEVLRPFAGQNNPLLENVKIFRWWSLAAKSEQVGKSVSIVARLNDVEDSPFIVEKAVGKGRVVVLAVPADADWHNWTGDPSYLLVMQDLVRYLSSNRATTGLLTVGEPIRQPVDLTQYEIDATLSGPRELKANLQAAPPEAEEKATAPAGVDGTVWQVAFPAAQMQGFYELTLARRDGGSDIALFAANVDPGEGNLKRVDVDAAQRQLAGTGVEIISAVDGPLRTDAGTRTEIWWYLLWAVVAVLASEQLLGWFFGRRRQ